MRVPVHIPHSTSAAGASHLAGPHPASSIPFVQPRTGRRSADSGLIQILTQHATEQTIAQQQDRYS